MGPLRRTPARGHHRLTLRTGGRSTYLVMQIHHEWVLVGRVSGRVKHSWRRAGESVGTGLIYRDGRLLGEGRVQLGLILAQQGCQRSVASSPLTPGRGAAGPPRERNRAGVTPPARGSTALGRVAAGRSVPAQLPGRDAQGIVPGQPGSLPGWGSSRTGSSAHPACAPCCILSTKRTPAPQGPIDQARWMCFSAAISPQAP